MSQAQQVILCIFGAITMAWIIGGFVWLGMQARGTERPRSLRELKARADASSSWYLSPFSERAVRVWKYLSWIAGAAWLAAGVVARQSNGG